MLFLRKIVFYIFALIYLVLCPLIVARMLGFVVNTQTHRLVRTGLIYVSTNPPQASVYIDGRMAHQKTPAVLRDLTPGEHFIRIELAGYNDWERNVPVEGNKATVMADTLLIPQEWPITIISQKAYQNIFTAGQDVLIAANPLLKDMDIFSTTADIQNESNASGSIPAAPLFLASSIYADGQLVRLYNTPPSPFILLQVSIKGTPKFLWINLNEKPPLIEDISDLFPEVPSLVAWDNTDNADLFAFYPGHIYRININDKAIYPQDAGKLPGDLARQRPKSLQEKFLVNGRNDTLIRQGRWVRLYPNESFGTPEVYDIAESQPSTNMYFEEKNGKLFYLDGKGNLCTAQILPYHP